MSPGIRYLNVIAEQQKRGAMVPKAIVWSDEDGQRVYQIQSAVYCSASKIPERRCSILRYLITVSGKRRNLFAEVRQDGSVRWYAETSF